jgi:transposase
MGKLTQEDLTAMKVLHTQGERVAALGRRFRVDESTVRYHLGRAASGATDGRRKTFLIEDLGLARVVAAWWSGELQRLPKGRSPNATALYAWLCEEHGYLGSVKSVRKYVARTFARPAQRPFRRVEMPPGSQAQVDWSEYRDVDLGDGVLLTLYVFHMTLAHSRRQVDIACLGCDQHWWHQAHLDAFARLGGVPATARIDNLRTGVIHGSGAWGEINACYAAFARDLGFYVDPCPVRHPRAKGKVERGVRTTRGSDLREAARLGLPALQAWLDAQSAARDRRRICPVTGQSVWATWEAERALLRPLPRAVPDLFDTVVERPVQRDCLVCFESRQYSVPYAHCGSTVQVRGLVDTVEIRSLESGAVIKRWPRHTAAKLLVDPTDYDDTGLDGPVPPPLPLGAMGQRLTELGSDGVERRSIEIYAALADIAAARAERLQEAG